jgi:hypothetical protein
MRFLKQALAAAAVATLAASAQAATISVVQRTIGSVDGATFSITAAQQTNAHNDSNLTQFDFGAGPVPITKNPLPGTAATPGYVIFDLKVNTSAGEDFTGAAIRAVPNAGYQFFNASFGDDPDAPVMPDTRVQQSGVWNNAPNRDMRIDTFIGTPNATGTGFGTTSVLGRGVPPGPAGTEVFNASEVNIAYGDLSTTNNTSATGFVIARFVLTGANLSNAGGMVEGEYAIAGSPPVPFNLTFGGGGGPTTPEPASLGVLALAGVLGLRRRS